MATWEEDIVQALRNLGGTGTYAEIYAAVEEVRPSLPVSWKDVIRRVIQDRSSDSTGFKGGADLFFSVEGLGQGIWGLRALARPTPIAADVELPAGNSQPGRVLQATYRILRDTALAREVKLLHRDVCQICSETLKISATRSYSEAHHIIPLGGAHRGPDVAGNVIVLCPNHHALCDMGAIPLRREALREAAGHVISEESIRYHNERIFGQIF